MTNEHPYDDVRAAFTDADTQFQQTLSSAFTAHTQCVAMFHATLIRVERRETELRESVEELKQLVLQQGAQITELRAQLTEARAQITEQGRQITELRAEVTDLRQRQRIDARGQQL